MPLQLYQMIEKGRFMMPLQNLRIQFRRLMMQVKISLKFSQDILRSMPTGPNSNQFLCQGNSPTQINSQINFMSFGLASNPIEISSTKMSMIWSRLVVEMKESIWKKRIESSRWISLKARKKGSRSQFYLLMKMILELKESKKNRSRKDSQKRREKLNLSSKGLSRKIKDNSRYKKLLG